MDLHALPIMSMDICTHPWISMDIRKNMDIQRRREKQECIWNPIHIHGYPRIRMYLKPWISMRIYVSKSMDGSGHKYKSLDIRVLSCVFRWMYVHGYLWISVRIYVLKSMDGCKHPWISRDMTWTSMNNANFSGRWKPSFCKNNTHPHCSGVDFYPSPWKKFIPKFEKKQKNGHIA